MSSDAGMTNRAAPLHMIDLIRKKRDGEALDAHEIGFIVAGQPRMADSAGAIGGVADGRMAQWTNASRKRMR